MASRGVNKVILVGNLGQDPEVRYMPNGGAVANITLATSESWRDKATGEMKEQTEWHRVVVWRGLAEVVEKYVKKGSKVYVEGKLRTRKWEKDGIERFTTEILADNLTMLDRATGDQGGHQGQSQQAGSAPQATKNEVSEPIGPGPDEDDLPF